MIGQPVFARSGGAAAWPPRYWAVMSEQNWRSGEGNHAGHIAPCDGTSPLGDARDWTGLADNWRSPPAAVAGQAPSGASTGSRSSSTPSPTCLGVPGRGGGDGAGRRAGGDDRTSVRLRPEGQRRRRLGSGEALSPHQLQGRKDLRVKECPEPHRSPRGCPGTPVGTGRSPPHPPGLEPGPADGKPSVNVGRSASVGEVAFGRERRAARRLRQTPGAMSRDNVDVVREFLEALRCRRPEVVATVLRCRRGVGGPDSQLPSGGVYRGHDGVERFFAQWWRSGTTTPWRTMSS